MAYDSLRTYLAALEQQGLFRWVDAEVDKDWEIATVSRMMFRAMDEDKRVGVGFWNIKGFPGGRVVAGVALLAAWMPASRVSRLDPAIVLRGD